MKTYMFLGIDDHEKMLAVASSVNDGKPICKKFLKDNFGFMKLKKWVEDRHPEGSRIIAAYEAGITGPMLLKKLESWGWECLIIPPHTLEHSSKSRKQKCDIKDARRILDALRGHYLAGNDLSSVWIPDDELRDQREIVRARLEIAEKAVSVKNQIHGLLKRYGIRRPENVKSLWTQKYKRWLLSLIKEKVLARHASLYLESLIRQLAYVEKEKGVLQEEVEKLSEEPRYKTPSRALLKIEGISHLSAMVFLTELGDLSRFPNRRTVGSYIGLVPAQFESGSSDKDPMKSQERKGRITCNGPHRVRKVLNQAAWVIVRFKRHRLYFWYKKVKNRRGTKKAIVGLMRRLAIEMWHTAVEA